MAYKVYIWRFENSTEYEIKHAGRYGAANEKRAPKQKATPEQIKRQNQRNKENWVRRLIKANFSPGDKWVTLKYPKGAKPQLGQVKKDMKNFIDRMRRAYRKTGNELKYIYRLEIGKMGGVHIHIIVNRAAVRPTDELIQEKWTSGRINCESLYERGGYKDLAEYMVKSPDDEAGLQMSFFPEEEQKAFCTYSPSRNLIRPRPECRTYARRTLRRLYKEGPKASKGYYIDKNSISCGDNPYNGLSYYRYTEIRIKGIAKGEDNEACKHISDVRRVRRKRE